MTSSGAIASDAIEREALEPVLVFEVADTRFGLRLDDVVEILPAALIRALPGAPAHVEGLVELRGDAIPVFDTRGIFGMEARPLMTTDHFVHCVAGGRPVLLWVDRVLRLDEDSRSHSDGDSLAEVSPIVKEVVRALDGMVMIQDLERLLTESDSELLDRALASAGEVAE